MRSRSTGIFPAFGCRLPLALMATSLSGIAGPVIAQSEGVDRLDEITITGSLIEVPMRQVGTAVSVIDGDEIELRGYSSLSDVLRTQPGISVTNAGGQGKTTTLRIRGEEAFRTMLVIDGVRAVDVGSPQHAPVFDSLLATTDLERVEVLRGPHGFIYGADAGGVVNLITRRPAEGLSGRAGLEYGRYATRTLNAGVAGASDLGDFYLSVTDFTTDGFNARTDDAVLQDDDGAENTTVHLRLGWSPTEHLRVQLVGRDVDAWTMYDGCFDSSTFETVHDCEATTGQATWRVSAEYGRGAISHLFAYSEVDVARDNFTAGVSAFATRGETERFEYTGSYSPDGGWALVYGLDYVSEFMHGAERTERDQRGYYVEYQGRIADAFYVSAGVRYDDNDDFGAHASSRISGAYIQSLRNGDTLKYRGSYGTGFRAPSLYEIMFNTAAISPPASETVLREETSRGWDIGVDYDAAGGLHLGLGWFYQRVNDEIIFDPVTWTGYIQPAGRSISEGVELVARLPLTARWDFTGNWTYNETRTADDQPRLRRPRNNGNVGALYSSSDARLRIAANVRLLRGSVDIGRAPLDNYRVFDLAGAYQLSSTVEVHGRIENLTDTTYVELAGFNSAGRAAYAGVRLRF